MKNGYYKSKVLLSWMDAFFYLGILCNQMVTSEKKNHFHTHFIQKQIIFRQDCCHGVLS